MWPRQRTWAKIAAACAANETFAQVAGSTTYTLGQTNFHSEQRTISSSNPLMDASGAYYKDSVKWVKGGFTTLQAAVRWPLPKRTATPTAL